MATTLQPGTYDVPSGSTLTVPSSTPPSPTPSPQPPGTKVADEGGTFTLSVAQRVSYGADTRWVTKLLPKGQNVCSEATFGSDPAFGVKKICKIAEASAPTPPSPSPGPSPSPQPPSDYKALAYDWMGPAGIAFRFGPVADDTTAPTVTEKEIEGYTQTGNSPPVYYSFGPPNYNDPNLYMTVNAIAIGPELPALKIREVRDKSGRITGRRAARAAVNNDAAHGFFQNGSIGSETAAFLPQMCWQWNGTTVPQELGYYHQKGYLSASEPADRPIATYRGESTGDAAVTRTSLVVTQGSDTVPAKMYTCGTITAHNECFTSFPLGLVPTALCVTSHGEFALVCFWDTVAKAGKLGVVALGEGGDGCDEMGLPRYDWWHTWQDMMHPGWAGQGNYCFAKLVGLVDLPFTMPTAVKATTGVSTTVGTMYLPDGTINGYQFVLSPLKDHLADFKPGGQAYEFYAKGGVAIVASQSERKVCFVDLGPLFAWVNAQYIEHNVDTHNMGHGADQWPFQVPAASLPKVVKTVDAADDVTAVWTTVTHSYWSKDDRQREYEPDGPFVSTPHYPKAGYITRGGEFVLFALGQYAAGVKPTTPQPDEIREIGRHAGVGANITCLAVSHMNGSPQLPDAFNATATYVDRASSSFGIVHWSTGEGGNSATIGHKTLVRDSRMKNPTYVAPVTNYHTDWNAASVACDGGVLNYRFVPYLKYGGDAPQWSPAQSPPEGQYGGKIQLNCRPYVIFCSNVP